MDADSLKLLIGELGLTNCSQLFCIMLFKLLSEICI